MGLISFGKITKAHGLAGEVKFLPHSGELDNISTLQRIFVYKTQGSPPSELTIAKCRIQRNSAILKIKGVNTIEDAERLIGSVVYADTSDFVELEEGEFYWNDLIGLKVYTDESKFVGVVDSLIDRSMQSLLVVKDNDKEHLIHPYRAYC